MLKKWTTFKYRLELWPPDVSKLEKMFGIQTTVYIFLNVLYDYAECRVLLLVVVSVVMLIVAL